MRAYPERKTLRRVEALALVLFFAIAADVWFGGFGTRLDQVAADWVLAHADAASRAIFDEWVSAPGHTTVVFGVLILGAALCFGLGRWFNGALLLGGAVLAVLIVESLKILYARERPLDGLEADAFPSGHVSKAVIAWGLTFGLVLDALVHRKPGAIPGMVLTDGTSRVLIGLWLLLGLVTMAGRVFSGEHWVTDTVASLAFGVAAVCEILALHDRFADEAEPERKFLREPPSR